MFKKTANDLGLDQVLQKVSSFALSNEGKNAVLRALPQFNGDEYAKRQSRVACVIDAIIAQKTKNISVESFPDISFGLDYILHNPTGSLEGTWIYDIGLFIESAIKLRSLFLLSDNIDVNTIIENVDDDLVYLKNEIFKILESPGNVKTSYPTVKKLIEKAESKRLERTSYSNKLMHENSAMMSGENAVVRDGRIVLPVKAECHSKFLGYIQGSSQSGATVFMEPFALVNLNNEVNLAIQAVDFEIARLVASLSVSVRSLENRIRILQSQITDADFLYSFASWALTNNCCKVLHSDEYCVNLIKARHPLLKDKCVPIDLCIPNIIKSVVLTGPNAGGKTVTMKTVGLFVLLNQICGYLPASDGTSLCIFDRVFTDIGDEQSIENQLSTFSGHMKSISFVLRSVTPDSLVILDELGSGTDPQEGAALARAILEYCNKKTKLTLVTSHHGVLKQYAYSCDVVLNASMEFDENTLEPTFKVLSGLPGESHAIDTARRMHLPKSVTFNASKYMGKEAVKISSIIRGLESKRKEIESMENQTRDKLKLAEIKLKELEDKEYSLNRKENLLKKEKLRDFDDFVKQTRKDLEELVKELREGEITKEKTKKVKEKIMELEKEKDLAQSQIKEREEELDAMDYDSLLKAQDNVELKEGMDVLCGQFKREGTVIKSAGNGKWVVAIGPMKFTFKETELSVPIRKEKTKNYSYENSAVKINPKLNLDLRGMRLSEALQAIDDEIEACSVHGIKSFSVIHGYGDGILSTGIHKHLKTSTIVLEYHFALPEDGGQGKTYVSLK